jgi:energy-coupling factor transport system substrate-specific component
MGSTTTKKKYSIKEEFNLVSILTIPIAVAINIVGDQIVQALKLPIFLDAIGVIFMGMISGPWSACVAGILTNLVEGIVDNPTLIPFAITSAATGLVTGFFARAGWFSDTKHRWKVVVIPLCLIISTICTASPITVFAFGGVSGNGGQSLAIAALLATGQNIWTSVIGTDFIVNAIDRAISIVISYAVIKVMPAKTLIKYALGSQYVNSSRNDSE